MMYTLAWIYSKSIKYSFKAIIIVVIWRVKKKKINLHNFQTWGFGFV